MEPEDTVNPSASDTGFSAFLQAVAAAPPPDRAFAPGATVGDGFRISRPLFESGDAEVHLATGPSGDVALLRRRGADLRAHAPLIAAWAREHAEGRVRVGWHDRVGSDVVLACTPVPVGTLRGWLDAAPHPWAEVVARLGPLAHALARAHAAGLRGFTVDADHVWLGLDGRVRLPPPEPGGESREERAQLRALVRAAVGPGVALPRAFRRDVSTQAMAAALTRGRTRSWPWAVAGVALALGGFGAFRVTTEAEAPKAPFVAEPAAPDPPRRELWTRAAMRVDAGDAGASALVEALAQVPMPAHASLLRARLAGDAATWEHEVRRAASLPCDDLAVRAEIALERADLALHRGGLLEARRWLALGRRWADATPDAPRAALQRVEWSIEAEARGAQTDLRAIRAARDRASAPSLRRAELQALEAEVLAATGSQWVAVEQHQTVLEEPRADLARLRLEHRLARAHLLAQSERPVDAARLLDGLERDATTPRERASVALGRAAVARVRGDAPAASRALERAEDALGDRVDVDAAVDLAFERALWRLHAGAFNDARDLLSLALARHDALRGLDARSRGPLELAYRRALREDPALMTSAPPSRASASP